MSTQNNILFVGDSHSHGYASKATDSPTKWTVSKWGDNNYAEYYSRNIEDSQCYVYSSPGACNQIYPRWIRDMLNKHNDISAVVLQTTHWDRWQLAFSKHFGFDELAPDHFTQLHFQDESVVLYEDYFTQNYENVEWFDKVKFHQPHGAKADLWPWHYKDNVWPGDEKPYFNTKFHHEVVTHLTHEQYSKDIALIDAMCAEKDIPCYIWRIIDGVEMPNNFNHYRNLTQTHVMHTPANIWIKENLNMDIETMKVDKVHYNNEAHKLIAKHFIPELLKCPLLNP